MKKCGSCFRCRENWRDAEAKGVKPVYYGTFGEYSHKPRKGIAIQGSGINCHKPMKMDIKACEYYHPRWKWNFEQWRQWRFKPFLRNIKVFFGRYIYKPLPITEYEDDFDGMTDTVIPNAIPLCPRCKEWSYVSEIQKHCPFCGQRYVMDDLTFDKKKISVPEHITSFKDGQCPKCGHHTYGYNDLPMQCSNCDWTQDSEKARVSSERLNKLFDEMFTEEDGK